MSMPAAQRARSSSTLIVIALFAIGVIAAVVVLIAYGGDSFLPGLIAGFLGTLLAFVLALMWERERERQELERASEELNEQRKTEVRRRFESVRAELKKNAESLRLLAKGFERKEKREAIAASVVAEDSVRSLNPQLLEGAWVASAPRLSELIADYQLIADLATTYGRIEELRWRIRYRTEQQRTSLDRPIRHLAVELRDNVDDLLERITQQIKQPSVQPRGLLHQKGGTLGASVTTSASGETNMIRRDEP
jgi:hypothetical protein